MDSSSCDDDDHREYEYHYRKDRKIRSQSMVQQNMDINFKKKPKSKKPKRFSKIICCKLNPIIMMLLGFCFFVLLLVVFLVFDIVANSLIPRLQGLHDSTDPHHQHDPHHSQTNQSTILLDKIVTNQNKTDVTVKLSGVSPPSIAAIAVAAAADKKNQQKQQQHHHSKARKTHSHRDLEDPTLEKVLCRIYDSKDFRGCGPHGKCFYINDEDVFTRECICDKDYFPTKNGRYCTNTVETSAAFRRIDSSKIKSLFLVVFILSLMLAPHHAAPLFI